MRVIPVALAASAILGVAVVLREVLRSETSARTDEAPASIVPEGLRSDASEDAAGERLRLPRAATIAEDQGHEAIANPVANDVVEPAQWNFLEPWRNGARRERTPSAVFEERYRGATRSELESAVERLDAVLNGRKLALFDARHEAGLYVEREFEPMDVDRDGTIDAGEVGLEIGLTSADPFVQSKEVVLPDGRHVSHVVWIPVEEYPELYEQFDEARWLGKQLRD